MKGYLLVVSGLTHSGSRLKTMGESEVFGDKCLEKDPSK